MFLKSGQQSRFPVLVHAVLNEPKLAIGTTDRQAVRIADYSPIRHSRELIMCARTEPSGPLAAADRDEQPAWPDRQKDVRASQAESRCGAHKTLRSGANPAPVSEMLS